jgi:HAE1 family hydrophobic/amphiphilic exporter-1
VIRVSNRLEQVPEYPADAERPAIRTDEVRDNAIAWFMMVPTEGEGSFDGDIYNLYDFLDQQVKPEFERVPGVGSSNVFGGRRTELHVVVDPEKLAAHRITFGELRAALDRENRNFSGGTFDEGKRRYRVRTMGEYVAPEEIDNVVIAVKNGVAVYLRDVGHAEIGFRKASGKPYYMGESAMAMNVTKEPGANVLQVMTDVKARLEVLNREILNPRGLNMIQAYDQTDYIYSAMNLVSQNLLVGGSLAILILLLFLRNLSSTFVVAAAIPISVIGTFMMMNALGRTINVISLAGMAFAVGMVVDNSIVSLENIYRHLQMGKSRAQAAFDGAKEVWGAVLASTLTTIAVFLPVVFIEEEAGQLFKDIAIAISCAVGLSLIVAVTVIPSLSAKILARPKETGPYSLQNLFGLAGLASRLTDGVSNFIYWLCGGFFRRVLLVGGMMAAAVFLSIYLAPKTEYLPQGNRNLLLGIVLPPPGYNIQEVSDMRLTLDDQLGDMWQLPPEERVDLPGGGAKHMFFIALSNQAFFGIIAEDPTRVRELIPPFTQVVRSFPGTIGFVRQTSLFQSGRQQGRAIDIQLSGPDLNKLVEVAGSVFGQTMRLMPTAQVRPVPSLDLGDPELQVVTNRRRAAEAGVSNRELGFTVSALIDGVKASDYTFEGREIDLMVRGPQRYQHRSHLLDQLPIATARGDLVTLGSLADIQLTSGPTQINHVERVRSVMIQVVPPDDLALQEAAEMIDAEILVPLRASGQLTDGMTARLAGAADQLAQMLETVKWNVLLALIITYLLMAALFESFLYPLVIMISVPLAAMGGFLGLSVLNLFTFQALDVLTMLGFIILIGTVVNNAILVVHQSLNHMRQDDMPHREAIREATRSRIRPIFMSVMTSVFGMLPLVLFPGAGSELYRGLGSVVVGGLVVSTVFTLFLVPALFSLVLDAKRIIGDFFSGFGRPEQPAEGD